MANGILKNLNRSLEITLRDNLDGLKEFTLMVAASSVRPQYEILPVEHMAPPTSEQPSNPLTLIDKPIVNTHSEHRRQQKKRA